MTHRTISALLIVLFVHSISLFAMDTHSLVVRVKTYNSVEVDSDIPGIKVSYMQYQTTHHACRLQAGDTAILQITGLPNGELISAQVSVHSNKESGSGSLLLTDYTMPIWGIADAPFSSNTWNGVYASDYTLINHHFTKSYYTGDICLRITASSNSIYFNEFTLVYQTPEKTPHTIQFDTHSTTTCTPITETAIDAGVVLPNLPERTDEWHFLGWATNPITTTQEIPTYAEPGTTYYPSEDITLHAVYADRENKLEFYNQDTSFTDGDYLIVCPQIGTVACSPWKEGHISARTCPIQYDSISQLWQLQWSPLIDSACLYHLHYNADTVRIQHLASGQYLTNKNNKQPWTVFKGATHSIAFYTPSTNYGLMPDLDGFLIATLIPSTATTYLILFPAAPFMQPQPITHFSSFIETTSNLPQIHTTHPAVITYEGGRMIIHTQTGKFTIDGKRIQ